jgi:hypothetical protein
LFIIVTPLCYSPFCKKRRDVWLRKRHALVYIHQVKGGEPGERSAP